MSQTATRSLADHFAEQAGRRPDAPALIWDGAADLLRRAPGARRRSVRRARGRAPARGPADRDPGQEVARGDRADPGLPALRTPVPAPVDRARARDARAAVRPGGHEPGDLAPRAAQRERGQPAGARRRRRRRRRIAGANQSGRRRAVADGVTFMLTTSGSTGLPKIVPLQAAGVDAFTDWAAEQFEISPARWWPTTRRSTSISACSTSGPRSSTAARWRSSTRTAPRRAPTSPTWSTTIRSTCSRRCRCSTAC